MTNTPDKLRALLSDIAKIGFAKSAEGYNAEYPFGDKEKPLPDCITKKELDQAIKSVEELFDERFKEALGEEKSPKGFIKECEHCKNCIFIVCYKTNKITYEVKKLIRKRWQESKEGK